MRSQFRRVLFDPIKDSSTMKSTSNKDFARAMAPMKMLSVPVGTWPLQDYNVFSGLRSIVTVIILTLMLILVNLEFYLDSSDAAKNMDVLVLGACDIMGITKVMTFRVQCDGLISNFTSAVKDYDEVASEEKRKIMRRHAHMGHLACAGVIFCSYFGSALYITVAMFAEEDALVNATQVNKTDFPLPSDYTVALMNVPTNFFLLIFVIEFMMLIVVSTGNLGSDSLFFGIIFHLCGQVEILKTDFSRLEEGAEKTVENFTALLLRHQYLLKLAEMLSNTVNIVLVIQLFSSCLLTCMSGFQLILALQDKNVMMIVKMILVLGTLLAQLSAYSYAGDYLKRQMEGIGNSIYSSCWYDVPKTVTKDIIFVQMRSQDPVQLMAGNFFCVNMETFMSILKTSMSYLSVLRATLVA